LRSCGGDLFEPINDVAGREKVCRAFATTYVTEGAKLPSETQESRYFERLVHAYPIHPEVFDRLYEDWTTLEGFQRTRGVLKLMAKVIYRLWKGNNSDLLILPGSLPLDDGNTRNELTYYLAPGWDAVLDKDIDGDRAETTELETKEPRFGAVNAARQGCPHSILGQRTIGRRHEARHPGSGSGPGIARLSATRADCRGLFGCAQSTWRTGCTT
jgi:predicted AAA+ superfamily ATPase